jgi:hypothetical protein
VQSIACARAKIKRACYRLKVRRGLFVIAIAGAVVLVEARALAEQPRAHLLFVREAGAERCPDEQAVRAAVAARLGYDPFSAAAAQEVSVIFGPSGHGLHARIELVDAQGEVTNARELTARGAACDQLASTVELSISMAIDPLAFAAEPPRADDAVRPAAAPTPKTFTSAPTDTPPSSADQTRTSDDRTRAASDDQTHASDDKTPTVSAAQPRARLRPRLGTGFVTAVGNAPTVSFGFTLHVGLRSRWWSASGEVRADVPVSSSAVGGQFSTGLYTFSLVPCFHVRVLAVCGLFTAGAMVSKGQGYAIDFERTSPYLAAGVRGALEIPLGKIFALLVAADLVAPIWRTTLIANDTQVFNTPPVAGVFQFAGLGHFR